MAKKTNDKDGGTAGFGEMDPAFQPPGTIFPHPGVRTDTDADWVKRDRLYKESLPRQKFY